MPHARREEVVGHSIKASGIWQDGFVIIHRLSANMRAREDAEWQQYLLHVGDGTAPVCDKVSPCAIRLPEDMLLPPDSTHTDLVRHVCPGLDAAAHDIAHPHCPVEVRNSSVLEPS